MRGALLSADGESEAGVVESDFCAGFWRTQERKTGAAPI